MSRKQGIFVSFEDALNEYNKNLSGSKQNENELVSSIVDEINKEFTEEYVRGIETTTPKDDQPISDDMYDMEETNQCQDVVVSLGSKDESTSNDTTNEHIKNVKKHLFPALCTIIATAALGTIVYKLVKD